MAAIANGSFVMEWAVNSNVSQGDSSAVLCDEGYEDIDGVNATCGEEGQWIQMPTCQSEYVKRSPCHGWNHSF